MHASPASSHAVQVGEIVAVLKTKNADEDYAETGRSPKKAKQHSPLYPFAFTGTNPTLIFTLEGTLLHQCNRWVKAVHLASTLITFWKKTFGLCFAKFRMHCFYYGGDGVYEIKAISWAAAGRNTVRSLFCPTKVARREFLIPVTFILLE